MATTSLKLTAAQQALLVSFIKDRMQSFDIELRRYRYDKIDQALQLEDKVRRQKDNDKTLDYYQDIQIGSISPAIDTIQGFFTDLYVSSTPIFPVLGLGDEALGAVGQFNAVLEQEERDFRWGRQLSLWFRQGAKYNAAALEVEFVTRTTAKVNANAPSSIDGKAAVASAVITGNRMKAWDMYNTYYDDSVALPDICETGEYAATVEPVSQIKLAQMLKDLAYDGGNILNEDKIYGCFSGVDAMEWYKRQHITNYSELNRKDGKGWQGYFDDAFEVSSAPEGHRGPISRRSLYEVVTFYCRLIPMQFKIFAVPDPRAPMVFKVVMVKDTIIYCEFQNNVHGLLPVVFCQPREENIGEQIKSTAELLMPLQNLATQIYDARLAALARATNDRLVYVKGIVDQRDIDSNSPVSRIGFKPSSLYTSASQVVQQLPFTDSIGGTMINEMNFIESQGQKLTRLNRPQLGQFQKGNKTLGEFNTVMQNSQTELRIMGVLLENQSITPLKQILLSNILQFKPSVTVVDTNQKEVINFNPAEVRKTMLVFKLADGLRNPEEEMDLQLAREFYQFASTNPEFQQRYDMVGISSYLFQNSGLNIKQFERKQVPPAPAVPAAATPPQPTQG